MTAALRILSCCSALSCACLLSGCLFGDATPPEPETPPTPVVAYMIAHEAGDSTTVQDPEYGGDVLVSMQENFTSGTGEECKRASLVAQQREAEMVVICRRDGGSWNLAPRIWGQGINESGQRGK